MAILDLSKAPCTVTVTNTTATDMKISLSGHNQSFILEAGATVKLWAEDSQDLIGYLSQLRPGLKVNFPGLPGLPSLGLIPGEYTVLASELFSEDNPFPEAAIIKGPSFGLVEGQHYLLTFTVDGGEEMQVPIVAEAMPVSETESVLFCTGYAGGPAQLVEGGAYIYILDGEILPPEEWVEDGAPFRANPEVGTLMLLNDYELDVDMAGSVINLLSFEKIATPICTISTTVAGCTLTIVDEDSNVYGNLDTIPFGTHVEINGAVTKQGDVIDTFTLNGSSLGGGSSSSGTTYNVYGDLEIVLISRDAL